MSQSKAVRAPRRSGQAAQRANRWGWFFTAPFAVVFVVFLIVPMVYAFYVSLYSYTQVRGTVFTGLKNYARAFRDPIFLQGMGRVLVYTAVMVPIQIALALIFALIIDSLRTRFAAGSRLAIFLPYAVPGVIGALMWDSCTRRIWDRSRPYSICWGGRPRRSCRREGCSAAWSTW